MEKNKSTVYGLKTTLEVYDMKNHEKLPIWRTIVSKWKTWMATDIHLDQKCEEILYLLKEFLTSVPFLNIADPNEYFVVCTYACK
jgi:hypothetical protein